MYFLVSFEILKTFDVIYIRINYEKQDFNLEEKAKRAAA
jgi:hypothetical protein